MYSKPTLIVVNFDQKRQHRLDRQLESWYENHSFIFFFSHFFITFYLNVTHAFLYQSRRDCIDGIKHYNPLSNLPQANAQKQEHQFFYLVSRARPLYVTSFNLCGLLPYLYGFFLTHVNIFPLLECTKTKEKDEANVQHHILIVSVKPQRSILHVKGGARYSIKTQIYPKCHLGATPKVQPPL